MNKFFISFNFILCIVLSVVAILPKVQEYQPRSGLLQSSVVSLYTIYLTWSAMSNQPGNLLNNVKSIYLPTFRFSWTDDHCKPHLSQILTPTNEPPKSNPAFDTESIIGLVIWFICVLYSSIRTASSGQTERLIGADKVLAKDETGSGKPLIVTSIFVNRSGTWKKKRKNWWISKMVLIFVKPKKVVPEFGTMKRIKWRTLGRFSIWSSPWLRSTSWWPWPIGTSK